MTTEEINFVRLLEEERLRIEAQLKAVRSLIELYESAVPKLLPNGEKVEIFNPPPRPSVPPPLNPKYKEGDVVIYTTENSRMNLFELMKLYKIEGQITKPTSYICGSYKIRNKEGNRSYLKETTLDKYFTKSPTL